MLKINTIMLQTDTLDFEAEGLRLASLGDLDRIINSARGKLRMGPSDLTPPRSEPKAKGSGARRWWAQFTPEERSKILSERAKARRRNRR
jgi:hypothetical protein